MRQLMMVPVAALAIVGFLPVQAAEVPERKPIVARCMGTAGYVQTQDGPEWRARSDQVRNELCRIFTPDTARPLSVPPPPPLDEVDPTDPVGTFDHLYYWAYWDVALPAMGSSPEQIGSLTLNGVGDFACGSGGLEAAALGGGLVDTVFTKWDFDWSATFDHGVGEITGIATKVDARSWDPNPNEVRELSGTIVVDDGAAYGQCDDSAGASRFVATLILK